MKKDFMNLGVFVKGVEGIKNKKNTLFLEGIKRGYVLVCSRLEAYY